MSRLWELIPLFFFAGALILLPLARRRAYCAPLSALLTGAWLLWALESGAELVELSPGLMVLTAAALFSLERPPKGGRGG